MILCSRLCRILIITGVISNPHHQQEVEAFEENACYKSSVTNNNIIICFTWFSREKGQHIIPAVFKENSERA